MTSAVLFGLLAVCLYLAIREWCGDRWLALAWALVFSLLPHYATDRIWITSLHAVLSMIFALLGICALLYAVRSDARNRAKWTAFSAFLFVLSILAYEVAVGLILAVLAAVAWRKIHASRNYSMPNRSMIASVACIASFFLIVLLIKARRQTRIPLSNHSLHHFLGHLPGLTAHAGAQMVQFNLRTYALHMPWVLLNLQHLSALSRVIWMTAGLLAAVVATHLWVFMEPGSIANRRLCFQMVVLGPVLFVLGYGLFIHSTATDFTTAGVNNRITIASALAPACILVAGAALACSVFPSPVVPTRAFSLTIGLICGVNYLAVSGINCFWSQAANRQTAILRLIATHVPTLPHGSTLLLDGFCRYCGPGVVFESDNDTTSAVQLTLNDFSLKSDVVSPNLHFNDAGIDEVIYGQPESHYSYGDHVFVFNTRSRTLTPLPSQQAALAYLRAFNPTGDNRCPPVSQDGEKLF